MVLRQDMIGALPRLSRAVPFLRQLVPPRVRRAAYDFLLNRAIAHYPDRVCLRERIVPFIVQKHMTPVLSVGVQRYTRQTTNQLTAGGLETWTMDIDPDVAQWGSPGRHIVGDATHIDRLAAERGFACIVFNGVLGYGIDQPDQVGATLDALARSLPDGGLLVLGWNTDRMADPALRPEFRRFRPYRDPSFTGRLTFPDSTHVYDLLEVDRAEVRAA